MTPERPRARQARPARAGAPFLRPAARAREHRHRRAVRFGIAALLLLGLTPIVGEHVFGDARAPLTGVDHVGPLCLVALHLLLAPVHAALHVAVAVGVLYALVDRGRVWRRARGGLAPLDGAPPAPGHAFWTAARAVGLPPERLRIVDGLPTPAFTAGWLTPRVYVARALADGPRRLSPDALAAVLAHEGAHLRRRDPLRCSALRAMAHTLFWLPALRGLADSAADEAEVCADDAAAAATDPLTLAGALVTLAAWGRPGGADDGSRVPGGGRVPNAPDPGYVTGFVQPDLLDRRVRRLAGEDAIPLVRVSRRAVAGAALALAVVWVSGIVDVHALPPDAMMPNAGRAGGPPASVALHCLHRHARAFAHLLYSRSRHSSRIAPITPDGSDCPHGAGPLRVGATST